jgi:predicted tellurium resistance membrane protein TerC
MEYVIALVALTAMEIVLGIDNIVFLAILTGRLPAAQRPSARRWGLTLALVSRVVLLLTLSWILKLTQPVFSLDALPLPESWLTPEVLEISWRDIILLAGGLFLLWKSVHEIHNKFEGRPEDQRVGQRVSYAGVLLQVAVLDIVFSLDSVITAVGMVKGDTMGLAVMITAIVLAVIVMLVFSGRVSDFVERHPTLKMLALSFLLLIGVMLVAEGIGTQFDKRYVYFAMAFALVVETLNLRMRSVQARASAPPGSP